LLPPAKHGGRKRTVNLREVVNGIMYVLSTGCQWRAIPKDLPPRSTVHDYLDLWQWDGTLERIHHMLYVKCRELVERDESPTAAIIDSQSVKSAEKATVLVVKHRFAFSWSGNGRGASRLALRTTAFGGFGLDPPRPLPARILISSMPSFMCFAMGSSSE